jgi:hypothetical protein
MHIDQWIHEKNTRGSGWGLAALYGILLATLVLTGLSIT